MKTIQELAAEANKFFTRNTEKDIVIVADGAPEWVADMCRQAHNAGGELMFPDDWRYEFISDALGAIEDDCEDMRGVDDLYPYTHVRLRWLASHLGRPGYCDEAAEEFGGGSRDILSMIALGMEREMREVYDAVRSFLEDMESDEIEAIDASNDADAMQDSD